MAFFPWRFNNINGYGNNNNFPPVNNCNGYMNYNGYNAYNGYNNYNNCNNYTQELFNEMVQRNIEAEKKSIEEKNKKSSENDFYISEKISEFILNERNSNLFYDYLNGICENVKMRKILKKISCNCDYLMKFYCKYYKDKFEKDCHIKNSVINESIDFFDGILWAMEEECNSIFEITNFIQKTSEDKFNMALSFKNARIGYLSCIMELSR